MRRRSALKPDATHEPINVTPLIDVIMCLIIFFLIVGKMANDERARVRLPASSVGSGDKDAAALVVTIVADPASELRWGGVPARVLVGGRQAVDPRSIEALLRELGTAAMNVPGAASVAGAGGGGDLSRLPVIIRADRGLPYAAIEPTLAAAANLGITRVDYATERAATNTNGARGTP
ncbi:MAG: biopolymer transporter ExbD [Phycisphaerales bacterium]|jgi:biopolymer transport protein ExbD|nr:biopolymer transporter ExbD [Phycisphaerales bacterium]